MRAIDVILQANPTGRIPYSKGEPSPPATDSAGVKSPLPQDATARARLSGKAIVTQAVDRESSVVVQDNVSSSPGALLV